MDTRIIIRDLPLESRLALLKLEIMRRKGYKFIWTTRDDNEVELENMDLNHLVNTSRLLQNAIRAHDKLDEIKDLLPSSIDEIC